MNPETKDKLNAAWTAVKVGAVAFYDWLLEHQFVYGLLAGLFIGLLTRIWI